MTLLTLMVMCGEYKRLTHSVGFCCEPTHDPIGRESTEYLGLTVGGICVCKACHDEFYYGEERG